MKLNLETTEVDSLKRTLSLISSLRKFVLMRFSPEYLMLILVNGRSIQLEPQVWCKLKMSSIFHQIEVKSQRDNVITLEINIELLITTLKNFEKANSDGLKIRLQRNITNQTSKSSRLASLAILYSTYNINSNYINNQFRIPIKILKSENDLSILKEPQISDVGLIVNLPQKFQAIYKRFEKFKKIGDDMLRINVNTKTGLKFILEDDGKFKVTIQWNDKLEIQKPMTDIDSESLRSALSNHDTTDEAIELEIMVKLLDWQLTARLINECKTVILIISSLECALHCLLDDTDDVGIIYYISNYRIVDHD